MAKKLEEFEEYPELSNLRLTEDGLLLLSYQMSEVEQSKTTIFPK